MSARFTISGSPSEPRGYDAVNGEVLELELEDKLAPDVRTVQFEVYDPSKPSSPFASKDAPVLIMSPASGIPDTTAGKVTVTMPDAGAHSYIIRCTVNGGIGANGKPDARLVYERLVAIRTASGVRKIVPTETTQYGSRGWTDAQNEQVDAPGGGGGGGDVELDGEVTGPASATVVAKVGGAAVAFDDTETGYLAVEDGEIVATSPPTPDASAVAFDPTGTGLSATDVQGAIVEASGILAAVEIPLPTTGTPTDELVYTVPACIDATITFVLLSVEEQFQGAGTVTVRVGTTAGDDDLIIDSVVDSTTLKGNFAGKDISTLGTVWPASSGYVWNAAEGDEVHVRVTTNGTVDSGKIRVTVVGVIVR